ncbi:MAG: GTP-binding protein [Rhodospirillales bacterium]|jgi:G3E family GTPase|nr:GTP-binding protein [Rhodospirillaceae bacterium]MDP6427163.1 GTP-binding protein [Rhodospirillales bacterium]MDP6646557.1 GTP-binding protein [Rhodospirillales bacterium]MDP6840970.1 GTP-binding protein [Rhodospirillales bacterium]
MDRIWVTLITGFLGSGKTTLLNTLLHHPAMSQAAVIVNEFGEIGIDYDLVEQSNEQVVQLANGCLCCSVKGDLIDTFRDLYIQRNAGTIPHFDRVVIETTGIADPMPVLQIVFTNPMVMNHYALDGVVTTVDAVNGLSSLQRFPECVKQAAIADRLIVTKVDLVEGGKSGETVAAVRDRLRALNPAAPIVETATEEIDPEDLFGTGMFDAASKQIDLKSWIDPALYDEAATEPAAAAEPDEAARAYYQEHGHTPEQGHAHGGVNSFCITRDEPMSLDMLRMFLEGLTREAGPDLLRVKGIVNVAGEPDRPAVIQGAQLIFHSLDWLPEWPGEDRRTRIVFITHGLDKSYIEDTLELIERVAKRTEQATADALIR